MSSDFEVFPNTVTYQEYATANAIGHGLYKERCHNLLHIIEGLLKVIDEQPSLTRDFAIAHAKNEYDRCMKDET